MFSIVVFVEVITSEPGFADEDPALPPGAAPGAVGIGFFLLIGLFFLGILLALTLFHSSGMVWYMFWAAMAFASFLLLPEPTAYNLMKVSWFFTPK